MYDVLHWSASASTSLSPRQLAAVHTLTTVTHFSGCSHRAYIDYCNTAVYHKTIKPCVVRWCDNKQVAIGLLAFHFHVTTLDKLFTHICLCSPSSIIWFWKRAVMFSGQEGNCKPVDNSTAHLCPVEKHWLSVSVVNWNSRQYKIINKVKLKHKILSE